MNKELKVSVLMLTYNQERYIDEAIRSVMLQQTNFPFELIIGNDASTDATGEVCRAWKEKYPDQIVLLDRETNLGLQQNFIQSYNQCSGTYVAICEGDDFWTNKHKLQKQVDFLDAHADYSTCFHRVINYYEGSGTKSLSNGGQKAETTIVDLARSNYISNVSVLFRRNLFGPLPEWFATVSTYDYAIHLLNAQYGKIHYMKQPMAVYRQHSKAIWSKAGLDKKLTIALTIPELLMAYFQERNRPEVYETLLTAHTHICIALIRYYQSTGETDKVSQTEAVIQRYHPHWTMEEIAALARPVKPNAKQQLHQALFYVLKQCRRVVSRFIPLPSIS